MIKARIDKVWERSSEQGFVFALKLTQIPLNKSFLILYRFENKIHISLVPQKPTGIIQNESGAQQILRKYLKGSVINHVWFSPIANFLQIICTKKTGDQSITALLSLDASKGIWDFSIVGIGSLLRISTQAQFTKRKAGNYPLVAEQEIENLGFYDILDEQIDKLRITLDQGSREGEGHERKEIDSRQSENAPHDDALDLNKTSDFRRTIRRRLKTLKKTYAHLRENQQKHGEYANFLKFADLLKEHTHLWQPGSESLTVTIETVSKDNEKITIPLDSQLNLGQQLTFFYKNGMKHKKGFEEQTKRLESCEENIAVLQQVLDELMISPTPKLLTDLQLKYPWLSRSQLPSKKLKPGSKSIEKKPFWLFAPSNLNIKFLVGKSAENNDLLTKRAKSHDLWFHAMQTSGSHVIISGSQFNRLTPAEQQRAIHYAGMLALHYSSKKNDLGGDLYMTHKANLKKTKNLPPGKWLVVKAKNMHLAYTREELSEILKYKQSLETA